ncbi:hypothetical protein Tco_0762171 [Tanacetum coccineum]
MKSETREDLNNAHLQHSWSRSRDFTQEQQIFLNNDQLQKQLDNEEFQEKLDSMYAFKSTPDTVSDVHKDHCYSLNIQYKRSILLRKEKLRVYWMLKKGKILRKQGFKSNFESDEFIVNDVEHSSSKPRSYKCQWLLVERITASVPVPQWFKKDVYHIEQIKPRSSWK